MNAASRLMNQGTLSRTWVISLLLTQSQILLCASILSILITALSIIFVTNTSRNLHADIQLLKTERVKLVSHWGQLLLEKSTLTMQSKVEESAVNTLAMHSPDSKNIIVINE